eukprot:TRINITY_DN17977_c0_g1_i1.p1 TRINITY_DN17977_c0_g1~~TRINITY_DN17977_c0_g1_i1.p1  ORF type:complete len:249 (+),score=75.50 TRINITY_DN17977_c0_g1_i1:93-839(+)
MAGLKGLMNLYGQQQQQQNKPATTTATTTTTTTTTTTGSGGGGGGEKQNESSDFNVSQQSSKNLSQQRKQKSKDSVFRIAKSTAKASSKSSQSCELRVQNDLSNIDEEATPGVVLEVNPNDLLHFNVTVEPQDGYWKGGKFQFVINIPHDYPFTAPEVVCNTLIYHPNIDFKGRVCLNILRFEWSAALGLGHVLFGMMTLFLEPNPDDPLNIEAADLMVKNPAKFKQNVTDSLRGKFVAGHQFPKLVS